jgi:signal transduction histidine kinase
MSTGASALSTETSVSTWEKGFDRVVEWAPYVTLAMSSLLAVAGSIGDWPEILAVVGLSATAALWVFFMFTRVEDRMEKHSRMRVYFAGLLVLFAVMMVWKPVFFVFVITGFFHAFFLKPPALSFLGVGLTSVLVNLRIIYPEANADQWFTFGFIVAIQTVAIGFGVIGGEKIAELSEQRRRSLIELEAALEENAALSAQLVDQAKEAGVNEERQRMAREIHDTIAQGLIGVITQLEATRHLPADEEMRRRLDDATRMARESLTEARRSVQALRPAPLEERGLVEAIADVTERWSSINRVPTEMTTTGTPLTLHPEVEVTLLRVTQEALANVAKHSGATRVGVTLSYMGDIVSVDVRDNGSGIAPGSLSNGKSTGFGLVAMRQRVEGLSGTLEIESEPDGGTAISASLPSIPIGGDR